MQSILAAIHASDANETSVRAASAEVASTKADLAVERMKISGEIAAVLTAAQREKMSDMVARDDELFRPSPGRPGAGRDF